MSAHGKRVPSCGMGGTILLWDLHPANRIVRACRIVNRNLTSAEWDRHFDEEPYRKTFA